MSVGQKREAQLLYYSEITSTEKNHENTWCYQRIKWAKFVFKNGSNKDPCRDDVIAHRQCDCTQMMWLYTECSPWCLLHPGPVRTELRTQGSSHLSSKSLLQEGDERAENAEGSNHSIFFLRCALSLEMFKLRTENRDVGKKWVRKKILLQLLFQLRVVFCFPKSSALFNLLLWPSLLEALLQSGSRTWDWCVELAPRRDCHHCHPRATVVILASSPK